MMPSICASVPLRSSDSSVSSCSDISVEANFYDHSRYDCQEDSSSLLKGHLDDLNLSVRSNGSHEIGNLVKHDILETAEDREGGDKNVDSSVERSQISLSNDEVDPEFWFPPEPKVKDDDDVIGSVANYDDNDDECGDGIDWAKCSSLSGFGEGGGSYSFKEEKPKAMNNVRNGRFKALVSQLVKSVGVNSSENSGENWVDIVTSLSWEAAAFVKPETNEGNAMDPDGYVKVKCIATGLRSHSRVIKGLVFKKHAAHKRMPTKYKNARLLLIHGSLDLSSSGLSSFESMQQEKDKLKSMVEMIEIYHPNVILVEKSVSRDIQESILLKGMTLVFDMKLHRLERVARCIGSPILSTEVANGQKLRLCDSFHVEKFVEEHEVSNEGGKNPSKTLMFLEGCPSWLGCTIQLMGANSDELKRIKCVIRCAVVMAYHLMLETSFRLDQSAMFSTISPQLTSIDTNEANLSDQKDSDAEMNMPFIIDIPILNRFHEHKSENLLLPLEGNSSFSFQSYNPTTFPGLSLSTSIQKVMNDDFPLFSDSSESIPSPFGVDLPEYSDTWKHSDGAEDHMLRTDEISAVLDSESILVLMSRRNASKGIICEQSHFSHIKFYRSFDVLLGKFLHDNLLNQKLQCKCCGETPEAHLFYYAHHNKQLTVQVRHLPASKSLPGETEGKLWMWSRCGLCKFHNRSSKCTKRVLISTAARGLSFGKFLELSFSNHSPFISPSSCGHSFHKDFLYFFGLGPMVAMLKYSPVSTYSVSLPPQKMEFHASVRRDLLKKDSEDVYSEGISMFLEIENSLKDIESRYVGVTLYIQGSSKDFSDIVLMWKQEKSRFEVNIQDAVKNESEDDAVCRLLSLNRIRLELLLESSIWDRRLHALVSSNLEAIDTDSVGSHGQENLHGENGTPEQELCEATASVEADDSYVKEIPIDGRVEGPRGNNSWPTTGGWNENGLAVHEFLAKRSSDDHFDVVKGNSLNGTTDSSVELQTDKAMLITTGTESAGSDGKHRVSLLSNLENDKGWIWAPFDDIRREYMEDLQRGFLPKIESFSSYAAESMAQKLITDEGTRLHIPLGNDDYIVSDYEDEFSSIIACALALLKDLAIATEDLAEDARRERGMDSKSSESSQSLRRVFSLTSPRWSSFGSSDSDSTQSLPTEDSHNFDGLNLLDSSVSYSASHPEVSMGSRKYPAKRKYSVVCIYASQFRQLRDRCCPSELNYIASLSRCRNWDAKGGKSKSFFAKTLDDRFIIKEIKKTEFESFLKFAINYFEYMNQCYELGNQTCLAKILGIYQVTIRSPRNGKETRYDLLVMENLSFGRNIARQYDLKGALHARFNTPSNDSGDVLLDQNFVNDMNVSPLYVSRKSKRHLQRAIYNDTNFLNSINVMDYSLLAGVDTERCELACGIIDYLRQYTWDKQLENWVKSSLVVPKNQLPTIISPIEYKKRFRKFIDTHFLSVPDHWCSQRSSNPCKICGPAFESGLLHKKSHKRGNQDDDSCHATSQKQGKHEAGSLKSPHQNGFFA